MANDAPPPTGFKELIRNIWSLIRPNRVLIFFGRGGGTVGGVHMSNS